MKEERTRPGQLARLRQKLDQYPSALFPALSRLSEKRKQEFYLVGGTLRDWLLGRVPGDVDLTVSQGAVTCCKELITELGSGTFVPLGREEEDAGRVVWKGLTIDFSSFRQGARSLEEDLRLRDFTINSMGIELSVLRDASLPLKLIISLSALADLENKVLRTFPGAFQADPLRMLRGFRLSATLGFTLEAGSRAGIEENRHLIKKVASERISHELDLIMASGRAYSVISEMAASGLLFLIIPELERGVGMRQPGFHHLDVFHHSLAALKYMEKIIASPDSYYPGCHGQIRDYLSRPKIRKKLKWAALLHDLGKPETMDIREDKGGRITFYNHDQKGMSLVRELGRQLKWSNEAREGVASLVAMHMHPFHLCNVRRKDGISKKACLKLSKRAGDDLVGLFLLAMADSLAGKGEETPEKMEEELVQLFCKVLDIYTMHVEPTLKNPGLLSGQDLIDSFSLEPGPLFTRILNELQEAQVEGEVKDRDEALVWLAGYLER